LRLLGILSLLIVYLLLRLWRTILVRSEQSVQMQIGEKAAARDQSTETEFLCDRQRLRKLDVETLSCEIRAGVRRHGVNNGANRPSAAIDSDPPIALDKFIQQSGLSAVTVWRYRRAGWLNTLNICGRHYLTRSEIARFNARAAAGEFAKAPTKPKRRRHCKAFG